MNLSASRFGINCAHSFIKPHANSSSTLLVEFRRFSVARTSRTEVGRLDHTQGEEEVVSQAGVGLVQTERKDKALSVRTLTTGSARVRFLPVSEVCSDDIHQSFNPIGWADSSFSRAMHYEYFFKFHRAYFLITFQNVRGNACRICHCSSVRACSGKNCVADGTWDRQMMDKFNLMVIHSTA